MSAAAADCLARLLQTWRPADVLLVGSIPELPATAPGATRVPVDESGVPLEGLGRFDLAVVAEVTERLDAAAAVAVLGRLKNLHTDRFVLFVDPLRSSLDRDALLGLALEPLEPLDDGLLAWLYDIDRYNPERDWNNPEDWAHPENFDRFRW
jgi:hypothetical protein